MRQISLKNKNVLAQAQESCLLIQSNVGWTVALFPETAYSYATSYNRDSNDGNSLKFGFYNEKESVILRHQDAKITFTRAETSALIELINTAQSEIWSK